MLQLLCGMNGFPPVLASSPLFLCSIYGGECHGLTKLLLRKDCKKGQSKLHLLRRLRSFGMLGALQGTFFV